MLELRTALDLSFPFTAADATRAGITRSQLRTMLGAGMLRHVVHGVVIDSAVPDSTALRAAALARVCPQGSVVCDVTAAWLHGVDIQAERDPLWVPPLEVYRHGGDGVRRRECSRGKRTLDLAYDVEEIAGIPVTTALRTACDLGRLRHRRAAFVALNALAGRGGFGAAEVEIELPRFRGQRGVVQLRSLTPLVVPEVESPAESVVLLQIIDGGLPIPTAQWLVRDDRQVIIARLDFGYPEIKLAVEYDGEDGHSSVEQRAHDLRRRNRLIAAGWTVVVLTKGQVFVPSPTTVAMVRAGIAEATRRSAA